MWFGNLRSRWDIKDSKGWKLQCLFRLKIYTEEEKIVTTLQPATEEESETVQFNERLTKGVPDGMYIPVEEGRVVCGYYGNVRRHENVHKKRRSLLEMRTSLVSSRNSVKFTVRKTSRKGWRSPTFNERRKRESRERL